MWPKNKNKIKIENGKQKLFNRMEMAELVCLCLNLGTTCVTLESNLNSLCLSFLTCDMGVIVIPSSWGQLGRGEWPGLNKLKHKLGFGTDPRC